MAKKRNSKYPGLDIKVNLKIRHELMDADYLDQLNETEKLLA
jgi:hypothetical protein